MENSRFFVFRAGKTVFHKIPPILKLVFSLLISAAVFFVPPEISLAVFVSALFCSIFVLRESFSEIFSDLKPLFAYFVLLLLANGTLNASRFFESESKDFSVFLKIEKSYIVLFFAAAASLQIASILYRTTRISELSDSFSKIEKFITKKEKTPVSDLLSLVLNFLPSAARTWTNLENAWISRGGKNGIKKIAFLSQKLLKSLLREAYEKSLAIENRS